MNKYILSVIASQCRANQVLRVPRVGDFGERLAAEAAVVVDCVRPERAGRGDLGGLVLLLLVGYFYEQVQQVVLTPVLRR